MNYIRCGMAQAKLTRIALRLRLESAINNNNKNTQSLGGNRAASASVYFNGSATGIVASGAGRHGWAPTNSDNLYGGDGGVCARVRLFAVRAHACTCVMCSQYTIIIFHPG